MFFRRFLQGGAWLFLQLEQAELLPLEAGMLRLRELVLHSFSAPLSSRDRHERNLLELEFQRMVQEYESFYRLPAVPLRCRRETTSWKR